MPLVSATIKKQVEAAVFSGFQREFAKEAAVDPTTYKRMAAAIADLTDVIILAIQSQAEVLPGIPTAGSPASQVSVGVGKIT